MKNDTDAPHTDARARRREWQGALGLGLLLGLAALAVVWAAMHFMRQPAATPPAASAPAPSVVQRRMANFGAEQASADVQRMAHWVADARDNGSMSFAIVDKRDAKVFLFDREARLQAVAPALLGSAHGDDTVPGIGDKPLAQVLPEEKTTPAGRFIAEVGESSTRGEDVVWVDYDAAVSMHRVLKVPERLKAIGTPTPEDNRMSFGCINLPDAFYEKSLRPAVDHGGVVIYVLPETRTLQATFRNFYEAGPAKLASS